MSAFFNRLTLIVTGLVLAVGAVALGLVETRVLAADDIDSAIGYRGALDNLVTWTGEDGLGGGARTIIAVVAFLVFALSVWWFQRELRFGYRRPGAQVLQLGEQDDLTSVNAAAMRHLVEGAALEGGALSAKATIRPAGETNHTVRCSIVADDEGSLATLPVTVRERIAAILGQNQINHESITVTVDGVSTRKRAVR